MLSLCNQWTNKYMYVDLERTLFVSVERNSSCTLIVISYYSTANNTNLHLVVYPLNNLSLSQICMNK